MWRVIDLTGARLSFPANPTAANDSISVARAYLYNRRSELAAATIGTNAYAYVDETGTIAGQYVYGPYGNVIEQYGSLAAAFDIRFSTRYTDRETGLDSYKRRFYRPDHARWLNRDPIEESGGDNLYAFCYNAPNWRFDVNGCGTWRFGIPSVCGNIPEFTVSYEMDADECRCCKGVKVLRYVRTFITGGQVGPYSLDGTPDQFEAGFPTGYAPDDWPEGPGVGWGGKVYYRIRWSWDFYFEAVCSAGPLAGNTLSKKKKLYWAEGHKPDDETFDHGFLDPPSWWPDLTVPTLIE